MKKWMPFGAAMLLTLALCTASGVLLLSCMEPMEDRAYDLSLMWEGEAMPEGWVYDQKGWTVFTQEGEERTALSPDGSGGFSGLAYPGQTIYFSRVMEEELDSPTLRLGTAEQTFSVFLDGVLIYTDCPELDNRIGSAQLPTLESPWKEPLLVTLPLDYRGKTLTIAQSTNPSGEDHGGKVWPCTITLYCAHAYESALVAESFQTAVPAALAFAAGTLLLALFAVQTLRGTPDLGALCGGLMALFWMAGHLALAFLPNAHLGPLPVDIALLAQNLSLTLLLVFLTSRLTGWRRVLLGLLAGAQGTAVAVSAMMQAVERLTLPLVWSVSAIGLAGLLVALACSVFEWKRRWFFRCFCPLSAAGAVLWGGAGALGI